MPSSKKEIPYITDTIMGSEPKLNKIALSFDVEDWYHTPMIIGSSFAKFQTTEEFFSQWEGDWDTITEATLRLLNILDDFHLKATFFVVADTVSSYPTLVRELKKSGHEIACHGLHHYSTIHSKTKRILYSEETFQKVTDTMFIRWGYHVLSSSLRYKYLSYSDAKLHGKTSVLGKQRRKNRKKINSIAERIQRKDDNLQRSV